MGVLRRGIILGSIPAASGSNPGSAGFFLFAAKFVNSIEFEPI